MTSQASCIDCGYHHDPLHCSSRHLRKERLACAIGEMQAELEDLLGYEAERMSGRLTFVVTPVGGHHQRHEAAARPVRMRARRGA